MSASWTCVTPPSRRRCRARSRNWPSPHSGNNVSHQERGALFGHHELCRTRRDEAQENSRGIGHEMNCIGGDGDHSWAPISVRLHDPLHSGDWPLLADALLPQRVASVRQAHFELELCGLEELACELGIELARLAQRTGEQGLFHSSLRKKAPHGGLFPIRYRT